MAARDEFLREYRELMNNYPPVPTGKLRCIVVAELLALSLRYRQVWAQEGPEFAVVRAGIFRLAFNLPTDVYRFDFDEETILGYIRTSNAVLCLAAPAAAEG